MSGKPIVVVGSINMDLVALARHIPAAGETVLGTGFRTNPGGKGANQAVAVARLGYPVAMVGMVGADDMGRELRAQLEAAGVDAAGVGTVDGASGVALITVAETGENSIVVVSGANGAVRPEFVNSQAERIRGAGMVLAQLEIPLESVMRVAEICRDAEVPLMLDPAPARELPRELFPMVSWMTPNETEAAFYLGHGSGDASAAAAELQGRGVRGVVLKMGARGAYLADGDGYSTAVKAFAVKALDTTAAGDAYNGAFATALMLGRTTVEAARFAGAASAVSVTRAGAQSSMATMAEALALLGA